MGGIGLQKETIKGNLSQGSTLIIGEALDQSGYPKIAMRKSGGPTPHLGNIPTKRVEMNPLISGAFPRQDTPADPVDSRVPILAPKVKDENTTTCPESQEIPE